MTKKLFLATAELSEENSTRPAVTRRIHRLVFAEDDFEAMKLMEEHLKTHELVYDYEELLTVETSGVIGTP